MEERLVGSSSTSKRLIQQIKKLATVRTPVLLQGEAGTGKTTVAEVLHFGSAAPDAPLIRVDCDLSDEANFHAGLVGDSGQGGDWVQRARGGTLLLQNLEKLSPVIQRELVSVIRNNVHNLRLICTTSADLEQLTDEGNFNDELFYRVASLPVHLPPLRERTEDIPALVKHFAAQTTNPHFDVNLIEFTPDALAVLKAYRWAGNLTDLAQVVTKIATSTETRQITVQHLPLRIKDLTSWPSLADYLAQQEKQYAELVLHASGGNKNQEAKILGVDESKLP